MMKFIDDLAHVDRASRGKINKRHNKMLLLSLQFLVKALLAIEKPGRRIRWTVHGKKQKREQLVLLLIVPIFVKSFV